MKKLKNVCSLLMLVGVTMFASGCQGSNPAPAVGAGIPGYGMYGQGIQQLPGGAAGISFTAPSAFYNGVQLTAGQVGNGNCGYGCFYGTFGMVQDYWQFKNTQVNAGVLQIGGAAVNPAAMPGMITIPSKYDPGSSVSFAVSNGQFGGFGGTGGMTSVTGMITLSPNFVRTNFGAGMPAAIGGAIDLQVSGAQGFGGVLVYTSQDQTGYHGVFLRL